MFNDQLKVILYAQDVKKASEFWQSLGFVEISLDEIDGSVVAELAVTKTSGTHLVIYDRQFVETNSGEFIKVSEGLAGATKPFLVHFFRGEKICLMIN